MAQNKTKPTTVSVSRWVRRRGATHRRQDSGQADAGDHRQGARDVGPSIIGFDSYHYTYESGREGDMPIVGFSPRKAANVLYGTIGFDSADALLTKLGKHTTAKGCLYIKKLADVDMKVLERLIEKAVAATRARQAKQA